MMQTTGAATIDEYIKNFPKDTQRHLKDVRTTIRKVVPQAEEAIKYQMPTFVLNKKNLVHFAGYEHHVGLYPTPVGIDAFKKDLAVYKRGKGSVQFPLDEPMPLKLIERIVKYLAKDRLTKVAQKKGKSKA